MTLLTGAVAAFALYQGARAAVAFRGARTRDDVDVANLRALSAIAFATLDSGEVTRYVGVALFAVWLVAYVRRRVLVSGIARRRSTLAVSSATISSTEPSITA
jgi:hypothetical protein